MGAGVAGGAARAGLPGALQRQNKSTSDQNPAEQPDKSRRPNAAL